VTTMARLRDLATAGYDGRAQRGPQTLHIDVTNSCNTNCVTCWDHSPHLHTARAAAWKRQRVDINDVRALLDDVQSLDRDDGGLQAVILSGMGEPFTHPDIYDIIADVKARGLHLTIITNLVAADVERVVALGTDALLVGVQGASEESYLAFHPNFEPWHWARLTRQLEVLRDAPALTHKQVQVICNTNAHELPAMVRLAHDSGADQLNFKLASLRHGTEAVAIPSALRRHLLDSLITEAGELSQSLDLPTNLAVFRAQLERAAAGEEREDDGDADATAPIDDVGCFVGGFYARVTVDGTVLYCCNTEVVIGSLRQLPFSQWWNSARWASWRRRMRDGRYLESCRQCGKLNQNVKLSGRFREAFGDEGWLAATGRGKGRAPTFSPLTSPGSVKTTRPRGLPVLS